jgi:hypothetical protein
MCPVRSVTYVSGRSQILKLHFWFSVYIDGVEIVDVPASLIFLKICFGTSKLTCPQQYPSILPRELRFWGVRDCLDD